MPLLLLGVVSGRHSGRRREQEAIGEYLYRERIEEPCTVMSSPGEVGVVEVAAAVGRVSTFLDLANSQLDADECGHLQLSSLLGHTSNFTSLSRREKAKSLHLAISSLQAHFLFLRLDWATSPGLPCQGYSTTVALTSTYRQLAHYWEVLVCLFSTHLASNQLVNEEEQEENTRTVVNERTHRRAECQSRRTRDCLVLNAAATVLRRLTRLLSETTR